MRAELSSVDILLIEHISVLTGYPISVSPFGLVGGRKKFTTVKGISKMSPRTIPDHLFFKYIYLPMTNKF